MISTDLQRVQINEIVASQLPAFARDDFPLLADFLKEYYLSQEYPGGSSDLIQNIDEYLKLETLTTNQNEAKLGVALDFYDTTINVDLSGGSDNFGTIGFPDRYGLIKIDDEIILYREKTDNTFTGCIRGFSGVTSYTHVDSTDKLTFSTSVVAEHDIDSTITNLSALLLNQFLKKVKYQFTPGFENRSLEEDLNQKLFISRAKDFYDSKGTDESFKILFRALYGEAVEIIKPKDFLFSPSNAEYRITKDLVVEAVSGDPTQLLNNTLYQDAYIGYGISEAYAPITDVEKITYGGKDYYQISVDFDYQKDIPLEGSIFGEFSVHPLTKVITSVSTASTTIDVDSTVGFPKSGELVAEFTNGRTGIISYTSTSNNQFYGISGLTTSINPTTNLRLNAVAHGYVGIGTTTKVTVRVGSVLANANIPSPTYNFIKDDTLLLKSLGITTSGPIANSFLYNVATTYDVKSVELQDASDNTYRITTYILNDFRLGDTLTITDSRSITKTAEVSSVTNGYSFSIRGLGTGTANRLVGTYFTIRKNLIKPVVESNITQYSYIGKYNANVQNTYTTFDKDFLVAASSLPNYGNTELDFDDRQVVLNGTYTGETFTKDNHGYYTGESVYYKPYDVDGRGSISKFNEMDEGVYFIKRVNDSQFKVSSSQANIDDNLFISVAGIVTSNTFTYIDYHNKILDNQKILKQISAPINESGNYVTEPGRTGVLINGVEILNYKSGDIVYYGDIDSISVSASGKNYDIINPPILSISDNVGTAATGVCAVKGLLDRIEIVDPGFDYIRDPIITITGGNGEGATAKANTTEVNHSVSFNAESNAVINLDEDSIGFSTYHKFRNAERVIYKSDGLKAVAGLSTDALYYVNVATASTIKLYNNQGDLISGINTVSLTDYGVGVQRIQALTPKRVVSNIIVDNSGTGYQNKKRSITSAGVNTAGDQINIVNHGYESGEIVIYSASDTVIGGLGNESSYVVTKVDADNFRLSSVGVGTTSQFLYYNTNQYINFTSSGVGNHTFNYEPISVTIAGEIGVSTFAGQDFQAQLQPVFRGPLDSVQVTAHGVGYGSSEIINYNRVPLLTLISGSEAQLTPVVNNGQIVEVLVIFGGQDYNSPPDLVVSGTGMYAKLVPLLSDGVITAVRVDNGGVGYDNTTEIEVVESGSGAVLQANIQRWTVNLFEKYKDIISPDDGILDGTGNEDFGIAYTHLYAPRPLRESIYPKSQDNDIKYGIFDLPLENGEEKPSGFHSPIIGWGYDGNPIYGPYGFSTIEGGSVRSMESGYKLTTVDNRPDISEWPPGFFVEDYVFNSGGDLDEHNGRFCVTPDYPNGTYAYFATINPGLVESAGSFEGYKIPTFPYLIGNTFRSLPNEFNYTRSSNQDTYNLNDSQWIRNTTPYKMNAGTAADYDFLFQPNKEKSSTIDITSTSIGTIENVGILTGGVDYQVGDKVVFDVQRNTKSAKAIVSKVKGVEIDQISVASTSHSNVEIYPCDAEGKYVAFTPTPHKLQNLNTVSIAGFNTAVNSLQGNFTIGVTSESMTLTTGIGTTGVTGIVTYLNVSGLLNNGIFSLKSNDIVGIGSTEKAKVLNVDSLSSRIRVLRAQEGTTSTASTATTIIQEDPRHFTFNAAAENNVTFNLNKEIYFDPTESLALTVGIGTTISFANPGAGITQIYIPKQSIYLPNHGLYSGDILTYQNNGGTSIGVSSDGTSDYTLADAQPVYTAKISNDLIGISTFKVGLGSTGTFTGIGTTTAAGGLLYFNTTGTQSYHSFITVKDNVVTSEVTKNIVTVSTASTHGLQLHDTVDLNVKPVTTQNITVKYNDYNRRIVFNPKAFVAGDVDTNLNTITISDHGWKTGDKVIHTATSPSGGLTNESIYYVLKYSKDKVRLSNTRYDTTTSPPTVISITSASAGTLSPINPPLKAYKNNVVKFDLSDPSLASKVGTGATYSAFDLNLYKDNGNKAVGITTSPEFRIEFVSSGDATAFEVAKYGEVGISADAALKLNVTDSLADELYYKFTPINTDNTKPVKHEIYVDEEVFNFNQIEINDSVYAGEYKVTGSAATSFTYNVVDLPENTSYTPTNSNLEYSTDSTSTYGPIADVSVTYGGSGYVRTVGISTVTGISTTVRKNAILESSSTSIGQIKSTEIMDIGFDYPTDMTLSPVANLPEILTIEPLNSFEHIGVSSAGKGYSIAPNLVVVDGFTGKQVKDVNLQYKIGATEVKILQNTKGMFSVTPSIIPVDNQSGVGIASVGFNTTTQDVSITLDTGFSDTFPFAVGDKVLIENVSVGVGSTGLGYNSANYEYALFPLTEVSPNLGGIGIVTYSLKGFLPAGKLPGLFDELNSAPRIIAEKDFPQFNIKLKTNNFLLGETVVSGINEGHVESWNPEIEQLKVSTTQDYHIGDILIGQTSHTQGSIKEKVDFNASIDIGATSIVKKGWNKDTGFLNYNTERLPDNNYYQTFSYSLKSQVSMQTWDDPVELLNHTSGFMKFSDLILESQDSRDETVSTVAADVDVVVDIQRNIDLDCYPAFDLVTENALDTGSRIISSEIYFNSRILMDYDESIGNRVLTIDNISEDFNSEPRATICSVVDSFPIEQTYKKYITYVADKTYTAERQIMMVSLLHDGEAGYLNQYGRVETVLDLGSFDWNRAGSEGQLHFCPTKYQYNDYNISYASFNILGLTTAVGIGSTDGLGTVAVIKSSDVAVPTATKTTIVGIGSTYRSSKILVEIDGSNGLREIDEINVIHDGTNVDLVDYGQLITNGTATISAGLGTYQADMSSGPINISFTPNAGIGATVNALSISIGSTSTGVGTISLAHLTDNIGFIDSNYVAIGSTTSPVANVIAGYSTGPGASLDHSAAYYLVSVEDTTNSLSSLAEVIVVNDGNYSSGNAYIAEYGNLGSTGIGTIGVAMGTTSVNLLYTPSASRDVQVRTVQTALQLVSVQDQQTQEIDLVNAGISGGYGFYTGSETDVKRAFNLTHNQRPIFRRGFDASDSTIVNLNDNTVTIAEHFFVSGEQVTYTNAGETPLSIASTSFSGIGTTSILPATVYIIDKNDSTIQFASSVENALKNPPVAIGITGLGVGIHSLTSLNPNHKCLIAIDNAIQSPIVATAVTTGLTTSVNSVMNVVSTSGVTSFFGGDLIQIDSEIMKINTVGYGTALDLLVQRAWMGTGISTHATNSIVKKVEGNYNIVDSTINFYTAPQGPTPISSTTNPPDDRDWVGITTSSTFQGRSFMRSGVTDSDVEPYTTNYLFDDISSQFNAVEKTFTLKQDGSDIAGFSTDNSIILVNGILQGPTGNLTLPQDYSLGETAGVTSITFTGTATSVTYDPNNASVPVGGVIVSVGSTAGMGYQPLVSAGGTAIVSIAGTITSVSIGNSGSGYRSGIQTVTVGIQTASTGPAGITSIGLAEVINGYVTNVTVNNPQVFYKPRNILNVGYSSVTGVTTVTTSSPHGLTDGEEVVLSGVAFTCDYAPAVGIQSASYDNVTGIMTITSSGNHGLSTTGNSSTVVLTGLAMTCAIDAGVSTHIYPRKRDPYYDAPISIGSTTATAISVNVGYARTDYQYAHTFVSAATSAVVAGGAYSHSFVRATAGAITANTGVGFTPSAATYDAATGDLVLTMDAHGLTNANTVSIAQSSIVFSCEMDQYGSNHAYPRATDPVLGLSTAISAYTTNTITVNVGSTPVSFYNVSAASYNSATGALDLTIGAHSLIAGDSIKIAKEALSFKCARDSYSSIHKYPRAGDPGYDGVKVVGVASATQFSVNVGISTVPTFYQSGGQFQASITAPRANNNSSSGQDTAYGGSTIMRIIDNRTFQVNTGISTRLHNYARGGKVSKNLEVVFDDPLSYSNLPLYYGSSSVGMGTEATIDVVVGQGSSVIEFSIDNEGYGYGIGEELTVPVGGTTGIPTDPTIPLEQFLISIQQIQSDKFAGWNVGQLERLDNINTEFDGIKRSFTIKRDQLPITIRAAAGSNIDVQACLLVFLNDVLQVPGEGYTFTGGSVITFAEAPKGKIEDGIFAGDTCKILFYKGTDPIDVIPVDILETVKEGDDLTIQEHSTLCNNSVEENERLVTSVVTTDIVTTNPYADAGINGSPDCTRPVTWCKQRSDKIINGKVVAKSRPLYEALINPTTNLIQSVGVGSTFASVDSVRTFFESIKEDQTVAKVKTVEFISQDNIVGASATAVVSVAQSITSVVVGQGGTGYITPPAVTIANPVGLGSTTRAAAVSTIVNGSVTGIALTIGYTTNVTGIVTIPVGGETKYNYPGIGYTTANPPVVLIEPPTPKTETNVGTGYTGDFGIIVGVGTTSVGIATTGITFDFHIPKGSSLRDESIVGLTTLSTIQNGFYFVVRDSNLGNGVTSLYQDGSVLGIGNSFLDGIYEVASRSIEEITYAGYASTHVVRVTTSVSSWNGLSIPGTATTYFGDYSWGRVYLKAGGLTTSFNAYTQNGIIGITTSTIVTRVNPLKYVGYLTT